MDGFHNTPKSNFLSLASEFSWTNTSTITVAATSSAGSSFTGPGNLKKGDILLINYIFKATTVTTAGDVTFAIAQNTSAEPRQTITPALDAIDANGPIYRQYHRIESGEPIVAGTAIFFVINDRESINLTFWVDTNAASIASTAGNTEVRGLVLRFQSLVNRI